MTEFRVFFEVGTVATGSAYNSLYVIRRTLNKAAVSDSRFQSRELIMHLTTEGNNQTIFADIYKTSQPCADTGRVSDAGEARQFSVNGLLQVRVPVDIACKFTVQYTDRQTGEPVEETDRVNQLSECS